MLKALLQQTAERLRTSQLDADATSYALRHRRLYVFEPYKMMRPSLSSLGWGAFKSPATGLLVMLLCLCLCEQHNAVDTYTHKCTLVIDGSLVRLGWQRQAKQL